MQRVIVVILCLILLVVSAAMWRGTIEHFATPQPITKFPWSSYDRFQMTPGETCSVYYTPMVKECKEGSFDMTEYEIQNMYNADIDTKNALRREKQTVPDGFCRIDLQKWGIGSNSPILNSTDPTNPNRGTDPLSWAFCFKPVSGPNDMQDMSSKMGANSTVLLNPDPLLGVDWDKRTSYARVSFQSMDYNQVRNDVCSSINSHLYYSDKIPSRMLGITVQPQADGSMTITDAGVFNYVEGVMTQDTADPLDIYLRLFEERIYRRVVRKRSMYTLSLQTRPSGATVFRLLKDVCGYQRLHGSVMGTVDLYDYGLRRPVSIGPTVAKSSIFYGTITMITVRRDGFQAALIDIQNQRNTLYENTQALQQQNASYLATINQKGTSKQQRTSLQQLIKTNEYQIKVNTKTITGMDMDIANRQQQIERLNSLLQTIEQNKKNAAMSRMRYLVGMTIPNTRDAIRSNTNGLIPEYVSNDNRIYLSLQ